MASKVEELRESLLHIVAGNLAMPSLIKVVDALISAAHAEGKAEGAEQERERIYALAQHPTDDNCHGYVYVVPVSAFAPSVSVLAPQPERGKPSQALLDELSEICGGEVTHETTVLAPTKEGEK